MTETLVRTEIAGNIARVTFDDPPMNPISMPTLEALHAALDSIEGDRALRCVILTGADLRRESQFKDAADGRAFRQYGRRTLERIETFPRPIVAAIHGYCIGGGTAIAWSCDYRIAAENTVFRAGDAYLGSCRAGAWASPGCPASLAEIRRYVLLLGENFGALDAFTMNLVSKGPSRNK
jgi:enoyl-CoA hydratase/carnithine racemase